MHVQEELGTAACTNRYLLLKVPSEHKQPKNALGKHASVTSGGEYQREKSEENREHCVWALEEARAESFTCDREKHLDTEDRQTLCMWSDQSNLLEARTGNTHNIKGRAKEGIRRWGGGI